RRRRLSPSGSIAWSGWWCSTCSSLPSCASSPRGSAAWRGNAQAFPADEKIGGDPAMNLTKHLRVEPGSRVKLAAVDPSFRGKWKSSEDAKAELDRNLARITSSQRKLYADRRHSLLVVLQGIDGAGKDGTCWHVISAMDPQGVRVQGFKQPTAEERDHDFLCRVPPPPPPPPPRPLLPPPPP